MNRALVSLVAIFIIAAIAHFGYYGGTPYLVMWLAMSRVAKQAGGVNIPLSTPPPTDQSRGIVKPSPDLAYTICVFDVSNGPVLVSGRPSPDYWSVALYSANSDNFHVVNDRQAAGGSVAFVISAATGRASIPAQYKSLPVVEPPSKRGIILFRYLTLDAAELTQTQAAQHTAVCKRLN